MNEELKARISEYGLNLIMEEIAKRYSLLAHIRSHLPYPYEVSYRKDNFEWFLMQDDITRARDLIIEFQSVCKLEYYHHTSQYSFPNSYECDDVCLAISPSMSGWNKEFTLPEYNPAIRRQIEHFRDNVIGTRDGKDKNVRINPLFRKYYCGSDMSQMPYFERYLLKRIGKYKDILSKGCKVREQIWNCNEKLKVEV